MAGGIVWGVGIGSSTLYGLGAATGAEVYTFSLGGVVHFCPPSACDGRLFVSASNRIFAFMLGSG